MIATFKKLFRSKHFRFTRSEVESGAYHIQQAVIMIWAASAYISGYCCELLAKVRCHGILNIAEACGFDEVATHRKLQDRDLAELHPGLWEVKGVLRVLLPHAGGGYYEESRR